MMRFELTDNPAQADLDAVAKGLTDFNTAEVGPPNRQPIAIFISDDSGTVIGGMQGYTGWGWLFTQWLWLSEALRGQGIAAQLLAQAEAETLRRGGHSAWIDTFNPVALRTYEKAGYRVFGELPNFVAGRSRFFLSKRLR